MPHSLVLVPALIRGSARRFRDRRSRRSNGGERDPPTVPGIGPVTMAGTGGNLLTRSARAFRLYCDSVTEQVKPPPYWTPGPRPLFIFDAPVKSATVKGVSHARSARRTAEDPLLSVQPAPGRGAGQGRYGGGVSQVQGRPADPAPGAGAAGRRAGGSLGGRAQVGDVPGAVARSGPGDRDRSGRGAASPSFLDEIAAIIPPEVAALRPEDLRVEAEFFGKLTGEPAPPSACPGSVPVSRRVDRRPISFLLPRRTDRARIPSRRPRIHHRDRRVHAGGAVIPPPLPASAPVAVPEPNVVVPPISIEPPAIRPAAAAEPQGIREVVLPASVVLAWSLFVLLAVPMAFIAGLMVGHYLWKFGP